MRLKILPVFLAFCFCSLLATAQVQTTPVASTDVLRELLSLPAPMPLSAGDGQDDQDSKQFPPKFYNKDNMPPDDAPSDDLMSYWERWAAAQGAPTPTDAVRQRLLALCEDKPEKLSGLLTFMPDTAETAKLVKKFYDEGRFDETEQRIVHEWLLVNSDYFLDQLKSLALKVKDTGSYVDKEKYLTALAKVDWLGAEPLLQTLSGGSNGPRTAASALALLHHKAIKANSKSDEEKYRERLQAIAADRNAPAQARDTAIEELSLTEWTGRDDWYLSLFADETLLEPIDGFYLFNSLTTLFNSDPDKWIPVMTKLVESKNRAVQQAAASCLVHYVNINPRKDAILPVLRWLSDPDWLKINGTQRAWFIQKMDELNLPESVPGLIWIVENEEENRQWAARTLAYYKDPRAVPSLKKALAQETNENDRRLIIKGLLASGGVSDAEQIAALEAYAAKLITTEGREELQRYRFYGDNMLPLAVSIGDEIARQNNVAESLVPQVLARAESLQRKDPAVARALLKIAQGWESRHADLDMLRRISTGTADAAMIADALEQRKRLSANYNAELQVMGGSGGMAQCIAAALLEDKALAQNILGSQDQLAQSALLACARLTRMALPVAQVGQLLQNKHLVLAMAAERYLLAEDSRDAQQLLLANNPNKAFITGWRENVPLMGGANFDAIGKVEDKLRAELFKENAPLEIFALLANNEHHHFIVRVYPNRAVYTYYENNARYTERIITKDELASLRSFVTNNKFMEMGPQIGDCHHDCNTSELLFLAKQGGRRVFSHQSSFAWSTVSANFNTLGQGEGSKVHYYVESEIKGLEVLYAEEELQVLDVWRQGEDMRVFVEGNETAEEIKAETKRDDDVDEDDKVAVQTSRRRRAARERARFSWRAFTKGKPGAITTQPQGYSAFDQDAFDIDTDDFPSHLNENMAAAVTGGSVVLAREFGERGLWKKAAGQKAVCISDKGSYAGPVITPDGKWVVAAKTDSDWSKPNYIVRLNLQTGRSYRVNLPPADQFSAITYLPSHGKVLLRRARDDSNQNNYSAGPDAPEFYLLDAATGHTQKVAGDFDPLQQLGKRFLQSTGKPFEFWAAMPDRSKDQTRIGRYSLKDLSFQPSLVVPHLIFDSMQMWVDESESSLYVVYEGQLLRLPLRTKT